jgi:hypothetical protein
VGGWRGSCDRLSGRREEVGDTSLTCTAVEFAVCYGQGFKLSLLTDFPDGKGFGRAESFLQEMSETTCHGRIESIYFGSHTGCKYDTELDVGGQVAGFVGCGRGGLGFERSMQHNSGSV